MATPDRTQDARALNVALLCKAAGQLAGQWPQADMSRLAASLFAPPAGDVSWSAQAAAVAVPAAEPELWLQLDLRAEVTLQCQRCLQAVPHTLVVDRRFRFARNEEEAERLDEELEDDVLALQPRLDLRELAEDELILALPLVARHEGVCPEPLPLPTADELAEEPAPNPFAALAALKKRN